MVAIVVIFMVVSQRPQLLKKIITRAKGSSIQHTPVAGLGRGMSSKRIGFSQYYFR
jgi:hypothetical protein